MHISTVMVCTCEMRLRAATLTVAASDESTDTFADISGENAAEPSS